MSEITQSIVGILIKQYSGHAAQVYGELSNAFHDFFLALQGSELLEGFFVFFGYLTSFNLWCRLKTIFFETILPDIVFSYVSAT